MIDWLTLKIPFLFKYRCHPYRSINPITRQDIRIVAEPLPLSVLGIPLELSITSQGELSNERHPWESIPSSFSGMAIKIFDFRANLKDPQFFLVIQGSPAKLVQGHNVYGSDDLDDCSQFMISLLKAHYPVLCHHLDFDKITVEQIDLTYFSRANSDRDAQQFITALANVSKGQTKSRTGYTGETVYFGKKNSRIKKLKVYHKLSEVENYKTKLATTAKNKNRHIADLAQYQLAKIYTPELLTMCSGMIRFEASLKSRWLERRDISTKLNELCKVINPMDYFNEAFNDIFKALMGEEFRLVKDEDIEEKLKQRFFTTSEKTGKISYVKPLSAYRTYRAIKFEGFEEAKRTVSKATFYRHLEMITDIGLSHALLQNLKGDGLKCEVIPMVRYITVDFSQQYPPNFDAKTHYKNLFAEQTLQLLKRTA